MNSKCHSININARMAGRTATAVHDLAAQIPGVTLNSCKDNGCLIQVLLQTENGAFCSAPYDHPTAHAYLSGLQVGLAAVAK